MKFPEHIFVRVPYSDERRDRIEQAVFSALGGEQEAQPPELFPLGSVATTTQLAAGSVATTTDAVAEPPLPPPPTALADLDGQPVPEHIHVAVPANDSRRERIERDVFAQLGAIRAAQRTDESLVLPQRRRWTPWLATAGVAIAATIAMVILIKRHPGSTNPVGEINTDWITTPGSTARNTIGDAVVDAGSDTKVHARQTSDGAVTLDLDRGSVDCDVEPRDGRPPFRVIAGDVRVEVIGTRFTVTRRSSGVRVDVTRGKVKVRDLNGEYLVAAGETWPASLAGSDTPEDAGVAPADDELEMPEMPVGTRKTPKRAAVTARDQTELDYKEAVRLMQSDVDSAQGLFQKLAKGNGKAARGALVWLSEIESDRGHADASLAYLDDHARRFPRSSEAEDVAWRRVEVLKKAHRKAAARDAAQQYLQRFPNGTYAEPARGFAH